MKAKAKKNAEPKPIVRFVVQKQKNFMNGKFWNEYRIDRKTIHFSGLVEMEPLGDIIGSRAKALRVADVLTYAVAKGVKL